MYDRTTRFIRMAALTSGLLPVSAATAAQGGRPNIVVIVADDLLSSEISCYGGRNLETTHIDRLAREGLRMTNAYASMSMSVPIRASLYTGLYPARHGRGSTTRIRFSVRKPFANTWPRRATGGRAGKNHPVNPDVYRFEELPGFPVNCVSRKAPYDTSGIRNSSRAMIPDRSCFSCAASIPTLHGLGETLPSRPGAPRHAGKLHRRSAHAGDFHPLSGRGPGFGQ